MEHKLHETYWTVEQEHWWFIGRRKILSDLLNRHLSKKGRILDVGCNSGVLVGVLQKEGYDAWGTDISAESIRFGTLREVRNLQIVEAEKQPFVDGTFDCVLALDVIEHIDSDREALREFKRLLKPGGLLVVQVPAYMLLWGLQDEVAHHKRRYTKKSLLEAAKPQGFTILRITYFNFLLFVPIALSRMLQKISPPKRNSDFDLNNRFANSLFKVVFLFESVLLRIVDFPFGVSLLLIAKK